ncbi:hypothetical protein [Pseudarthrobacter sp. TAF60_1]|uniref:hypothetical protein n=1 Tax=Pseudarthrobacter sp. TAF60_1 TaxID=3233071 RepID=UPI003F96E522
MTPERPGLGLTSSAATGAVGTDAVAGEAASAGGVSGWGATAAGEVAKLVGAAAGAKGAVGVGEGEGVVATAGEAPNSPAATQTIAIQAARGFCVLFRQIASRRGRLN